ncbi:MAG: hypothetical protein J7502_14265 [Flavisolibacter sp.]|nr:hypothetical protein [Flavisolibacter sp.]
MRSRFFRLGFSHSSSLQAGYFDYTQADTLHYPEETHFKNAEAYWSYDGKWIVFQRTSIKDGLPYDEIFVAVKMVT